MGPPKKGTSLLCCDVQRRWMMSMMAKFWSLFLSLKNLTKIDTQKFFKKRKLKTSTNILRSSSFSLLDRFCEILGRARSSLRDALKGERIMSICRIWVTNMTKNVPILKNFLPYFRISELKLGNVFINF